MPLQAEDKERLMRYIDFIESELNEFPNFKSIDWKTYNEDKDTRRNLERWIENLVNCSIDIAKVILVTEDKEIPPTYKEVLRRLGATSHFDKEFGDAISRWAGLRNILAHEYLDLSWESISKFLKNAEPTYRKLTQTIKGLL